MNFDKHDFDIGDLEYSQTPAQKTLFCSWDKNNGELTTEIQSYTPYLMLFGPPDGRLLPPMVEMGTKSLGRKLLGNNYETELKRFKNSEIITDVYEAAFDGIPSYQYVDYSNQHLTIGYERLVLPFKVGPKRYPMVITLSLPISLNGRILPSAKIDNILSAGHQEYSRFGIGTDAWSNEERLVPARENRA